MAVDPGQQGRPQKIELQQDLQQSVESQSSTQPELLVDGQQITSQQIEQQTDRQKAQIQQEWLRSTIQSIMKYETLVPLLITLLVIWLIAYFVLSIAQFPWYASIIAIPIIALVLIGIYIGYSPQASKRTGFGGYSSTSRETIIYNTSPRQRTITKEDDHSGKTLWDWLQLLIIPLALAVVLFALNAEQGRVSQQLSDQQHRSDQLLAVQQEQANIQLAKNQEQDVLIQNYLDNMQDLILNHNLSRSILGDLVREQARVRTLTSLLLLDSDHKRILLNFLKQDGFINGPQPIIRLNSADLSGANLSYLDLSGTNLSGTNLSKANLSGAILDKVDLSFANLYKAEVTNKQLAEALTLIGVVMPDGSIHP